MEWRNKKDWGQHIPEVSAETRAMYLERLNSGTCYVTLLAPVDPDQRLYGIDHDDHSDVGKAFWRDMNEMRALCGRGIALHAMKDVLLVQPVYDENAEPWNVPLCDLELASEATIQVVQANRLERARLARLAQDIASLPRTFTTYSQHAVNAAKTVLNALPQLAELAYATKLTPVASTMPSSVQLMLEYWDRVEVLTVDDTQDWCPVLRVTKNDVIMKFNGETFTRVHKSTDGMSVSLGKMMVEIGLQPQNTVAQIKQWVMQYRVYGTPNGAYLHPHITKKETTHPVESGLYLGGVCLGSYSTSMQDMCTRFDAVSLVHLWQNFLTSCSEGGWYRDFFDWMPEDVRALYCTCHKYLWGTDVAFETANKKCPLCGATKGSA